MPALDFPGVLSWVKQLSQSLFSHFSFVLTTNHSKSFQWTKTAEKWHNSRKTVVFIYFISLFTYLVGWLVGWLVGFCFFIKFSLLIQPWRTGHLNGLVVGWECQSLSQIYTLQEFPSWRLADDRLFIPVHQSLPSTSDRNMGCSAMPQAQQPGYAIPADIFWVPAQTVNK